MLLSFFTRSQQEILQGLPRANDFDYIVDQINNLGRPDSAQSISAGIMLSHHGESHWNGFRFYSKSLLAGSFLILIAIPASGPAISKLINFA